MDKQHQNIKISTKEEFEELFRANYSNLCAYANKYINDIADSEEIVQDVFFKLWNKRENLEITSSIQSYLYRSVRNSSLNILKHINIREEYKEHHKREISYEESNFDEEILLTELEKKIAETIEKLPPERRKIFILSRYDGLKYREIAEMLNISVKTVENQMGKAIKYMRENLSDYLTIIILLIIALNNYIN
ncbi:MAG: RNA polymerase sigma-70 factor [Bacteroidota bacterium]